MVEERSAKSSSLEEASFSSMNDYPKLKGASPAKKAQENIARNLLFTSTFALTLMGFCLVYFRDILS